MGIFLPFLTLCLRIRPNQYLYKVFQKNASTEFGASINFCREMNILFIGDTGYQYNDLKGAVFVYQWSSSDQEFRLIQIIQTQNTLFDRSLGFGSSIATTDDCLNLYISSDDGIQVFQQKDSILYIPLKNEIVKFTDHFGKTVFYDRLSNTLLSTDIKNLYQILIDDYSYKDNFIDSCEEQVTNVQFTPSNRYYYMQCSLDTHINIYRFNESENLIKINANGLSGEYLSVCPTNPDHFLTYLDNKYNLYKWKSNTWEIFLSIEDSNKPIQIFYPEKKVFSVLERNKNAMSFYQLVNEKLEEKISVTFCEGSFNEIFNIYFISNENLITICKGSGTIIGHSIEQTAPNSQLKLEVFYVMTVIASSLLVLYFSALIAAPNFVMQSTTSKKGDTSCLDD